MAMTPKRSGKTGPRRWGLSRKKIGRKYKTNVGLVQMRVARVAGVCERWSTPPASDASPGARRLCQLDPSHPQFVTRHHLTLNQADYSLPS